MDAYDDIMKIAFQAEEAIDASVVEKFGKRFRDKQVEVSDITFHGNKLRLGHLAGNRFRIRIRGVGEAQLSAAQAVLDVLQRRGVPNFFGEQRFGRRGDTGTLGAAIIRGDLEEFVKALRIQRQQESEAPPGEK